MNDVPDFISSQPVSSFDLTAIGIAVVIVMIIFAARWVTRKINGRPKYDFSNDTPFEYDIAPEDQDPRP